jgi:hypothetical protein
MINILVAIVFLLPSIAFAQASPSARHKEPTIRYSGCRCADQTEAALIILEGITVDAEVTLSADGLSPADRQATIFNITSSSAGIKGRTKIRHATSEKNCGVTFDYGRKYKIAARETEDGLETDQCLMRRARPALDKPSPPEGTVDNTGEQSGEKAH